MTVTFSRKNTPLQVLRDGVVIGDIRRSAKGRHFVLSLRGVAWRGGVPSSSGYMCIWLDTLARAKVVATVHADAAQPRGREIILCGVE